MISALHVIALTSMLYTSSESTANTTTISGVPASPESISAPANSSSDRSPFPYSMTSVILPAIRRRTRSREDGHDDEKVSQPIGGTDGFAYATAASTANMTSAYQFPPTSDEIEAMAEVSRRASTSMKGFTQERSGRRSSAPYKGHSTVSRTYNGIRI